MLYRLLLNQESHLTGSDLVQLDPELGLKNPSKMREEKRRIEHDPRISPVQKQLAVAALTEAFSDFCWAFTLTGSNVVELRKGDKDISVSIHNLKQYLKVYIKIYIQIFLYLILSFFY